VKRTKSPKQLFLERVKSLRTKREELLRRTQSAVSSSGMSMLQRKLTQRSLTSPKQCVGEVVKRTV
jgi:hypothetical protein